MLAPVLSELAIKMDGIVQITKIDTDKSPDLSEKYDIRALPTLILFNKGEEVERYVPQIWYKYDVPTEQAYMMRKSTPLN